MIVPGETEIPLRAAEAGLTVRPNVSVLPAKDAVKVTGVGVVTLPAATGNVTEVKPSGTVTVEGMLASTGDEVKLMVAPPLPAAEVSATVQVAPTVGLTAVGLHEKPFKLGPFEIVTVPLLVKVDKGVLVMLAEVLFVSWTREEVLKVDADTVKFTVAMTPFAIVESLRPHSRHIAVPAPYSQDSVLFPAPGAAATVTEEKSVVEKPRSH